MGIRHAISKRRFFYVLIDCALIVASYLLSYVLRFWPELDTHLHLLKFHYFLIFCAVYFLSFLLLKIYRIIWEYSNIRDVYKLGMANAVAFTSYAFIIFIFSFPYSRLLFILAFFFVLSGTVFYRVLIRDYFSKETGRGEKTTTAEQLSTGRILLVGAGEAGRTILAELFKNGLGRNVVGFVDDDEQKIGKIFNGKKILCGTGYTTDIISAHNIDQVLITMPSVSSDVVSGIVTNIKKSFSDVSIKILPSIIESLGRKPLIQSLREVGIDDLIGREEVKVDITSIRESFSGKTVVVTGAGGSIGSEICRQLLGFDIKKLIAIGRGEFSMYNLVKNLDGHARNLDISPDITYRIADVKDFGQMDEVFRSYKPDVVFHTAAHKHVPLMEYNESEALMNNVLGTLQVLKASLKNNISKFVLISTDKAVNPVSVMGASKRIAELITLYYHREHSLTTTIVRFGNVIGSRGSVIPLFQEQIRNGGPVTVTHPEIKRFFMTIPEASVLVINAASYSKGGEIFVLDMGRQHRVVDIARNLIRFYGYEPDRDIKIHFTGLRPGEKLYEELYYENEDLLKTGNEKIWMLDAKKLDYEKGEIERLIDMDFSSIVGYDPVAVRTFMQRIVHNYDFNGYNHLMRDTNKFVN